MGLSTVGWTPYVILSLLMTAAIFPCQRDMSKAPLFARNNRGTYTKALVKELIFLQDKEYIYYMAVALVTQ